MRLKKEEIVNAIKGIPIFILNTIIHLYDFLVDYYLDIIKFIVGMLIFFVLWGFNWECAVASVPESTYYPEAFMLTVIFFVMLWSIELLLGLLFFGWLYDNWKEAQRLARDDVKKLRGGRNDK